MDGRFVETAELALAGPDVAAQLGSASVERQRFQTELPGQLGGKGREVCFLVAAPSGAVVELAYPEDYSFAPRD